MTLDPTGTATDLARRLARFRAAQADPGRPDGPLPHRPLGSAELAERLASTLDGEIVRTTLGRYVRIERPSVAIPVDRVRLAGLPGQPDPDRPLICLDTETTGLATATGTVAFCIGLGWWEGEAFRQVQLLLPDHADEPAILDELARHIPADAWLVTYNGRGFDWPLLVTRFRMVRRAAPVHDGHLDLLPIVRRLFRHRMIDARLHTVEETLLGLVRHDDVDGWEIPARYLGFLRGGPPHPLRAVVRHNDEDVRSLARIIALLDVGYATPVARRTAPAGDLAGLARAFVRARRHEEALGCLDEVLGRDERSIHVSPATTSAIAPPMEPWWSPRSVPDFGGRPRPSSTGTAWGRRAAFTTPWDAGRIAVDRAHLLRRLGRYDDSVAAWMDVAARPGRAAVLAWIEIAKIREHRLGDVAGALAASLSGHAAAERRRHIGLPEARLETDLQRRIGRLRRRSVQRRLHGDLRDLGGHEQPPDPLADRSGANGKEIRHALQPDTLHGQRPGRRREPQVRTHAPPHQSHD